MAIEATPIPQELFEHIRKIEERRRLFEEKGIYINYVNPILHKGQKVWALGNKVYLRDNTNETFHDFILLILKETLGFDWVQEQMLLPSVEQHFIAKCFREFDKWKQLHLTSQGTKNTTVLEAPPNGWVKSLTTLAFDVATLRHASKIPDELLRRLKTTNEYQGARYELTVAGVVARLGFRIEWNETKQTEPHCEFIAIHENTKTKIAVEAKSRHRKGVLHFPGIFDFLRSSKGDVRQLLNQAMKKSECGKMPYVIFIDVNTPYSEAEDWKDIPWINDILKKASNDTPNTPDNPSPYNVIYFTNFSFHYQTDKEAKTGQNLMSLALHTAHQIPDISLWDGIMRGLHFYGDIPNLEVKD